MQLTKEYFDRKFNDFDKKFYDFDKKFNDFDKKFDSLEGKFVSKEHFDTQLQELNNRMDNMATKAELKDLVTKADLESQTKELEAYTDSVAETIIEAVDRRFQTVNTER